MTAREQAIRTARNICPNWMSPIGDAHYQDVLRLLVDLYVMQERTEAIIQENELLRCTNKMLEQAVAISNTLDNPLHKRIGELEGKLARIRRCAEQVFVQNPSKLAFELLRWSLK